MIKNKFQVLGFLTVLFATLLMSCGSGTDGLNNQEKFAADFGRDPSSSGISISSISPTSGSAAGGILVTVSGSGFIRGMRITLGGTICSGVTVVSSSQATCTIGAHALGSVDVVATNISSANSAATQSATLSDGFEYVSAIENKTAVAVVSGGGIALGTGMQMRAVIGEIQAPMQTGTGIILQGGIQGSVLQTE